ncbi:MerR family DNA-binding transcriptional regulator [Clostridium ganghwense]|uniref:MerR family DNA-binding transcriptional regulator n=1 Tax=Clostridium ganghwense TaxID=312089 RepID=A0ABT4CJ48_9CLOT|nr:MerR family DNA-binding transcriptional regulator [Clostridium ganghwense]MCY6369077.1 MerR family DNA-binding transcriptional regulator [Clostridium ganghwense]
MNIAEVSKKLEVSSYTFRYYEKIGLIKDVQRDERGNRVFFDKDIKM